MRDLGVVVAHTHVSSPDLVLADDLLDSLKDIDLAVRLLQIQLPVQPDVFRYRRIGELIQILHSPLMITN